MAVLAAACYHGALAWAAGAGWLVLGYLACLWQLHRAPTARAAFYFGWLTGLAIMVPQTWFIKGIFGVMAIALWLLMSVWLGLIVALWQAGFRRWGWRTMIWLGPVMMLAVEYFRSEVWPLKFAWHTAGFALPALQWGWAFWALGVYGLGAVLVALVIAALGKRARIALACLPLLAWPLGMGQHRSVAKTGQSLTVAGLQWENASIETYLKSLDQALEKHPDAQLFVCSEYSFPGPPLNEIKDWARKHQRFIITCGADMVPGQTFDKYYNTAFLTDPTGNVIHKQVKAVPIQFMDDGMPAPSQSLWNSPAGRVGVCICYDMNYASVIDELVRQGAQALIIPAMDVERWGAAEHVMSARLGATRAAEYGLPVFRLASSGISQIIQGDGQVVAEGSFPGQGEIVSGKMEFGVGGHKPLDRYLVWPAMGIALLAFIWLGVTDLWKRLRGRKR